MYRAACVPKLTTVLNSNIARDAIFLTFVGCPAF